VNDARTIELIHIELDGDLTPAERAELDARLAAAPEARALREELQGILSDLARIEQAPEHTIFGMDPVTYGASNVDALNRAADQQHRDRAATAVLDDLRDLHARVVAAASRLTPAEFTRPTWPGRPDRGPLIENIHHNVADHYRQHAADIREMLDKA